MISIDLLKNHLDSIPTLANIWYEVLGKLWVPDISVERVITRFADHLNDNDLPITFVALDDNRPVGMCSLRKHDGIRADLTPWLGSLVVDRTYQQQGLGKLLIEATQAKAQELGFNKLYLFTFGSALSNYYSRLGWQVIGTDEFKGHQVTVMEIEL